MNGFFGFHIDYPDMSKAFHVLDRDIVRQNDRLGVLHILGGNAVHNAISPLGFHLDLHPQLVGRFLQALGGQEGVSDARRAGGDGQNVCLTFSYQRATDIGVVLPGALLFFRHLTLEQVYDDCRGQCAQNGAEDIAHLAFYHRQDNPAPPKAHG